MIRRANAEDINGILKVYAAAKAFMEKNGNATQWHPGYPDSVIPDDIAAGNCYVEEENGVIHGVFVCILGDDPTYRTIEGSWLNDRPYAAVHRIGTDGTIPGFFSRCVAYCRTICPNLKIDTHENNRVMQHLVEKSGFLPCGTIITGNGTPRLAYQLAD